MQTLKKVQKVSIDKSQLVFAKDIHLDNLGPKGIVGAFQLDANQCSGIVDDLCRGLSFGKSFCHSGS